VRGINFQHLRHNHTGIVLDVSSHGFDSGAACYGSILVDGDDSKNLFLFYAGAQDTQWSHSTIGLAVSNDAFNFRKTSSNPILEDSPKSFCHKEALSPTVTRVGNRFYMILSGKPTDKAARRIGIAYADDPKGPWRIIGELIKPTQFWEGNAIDNGPSIAKLDNETILVYYSSITSPKAFDIFTILRRYPIRRIGILKVRIRGTTLSSIEALRFSGNPLKHLNGPRGSWDESLFCPGYTQICGKHCLFPAASTYSIGFPYRQHVGVVMSNSPFFRKNECHIEKLVDGPLEKTSIIPNIKDEIALDAPAPVLHQKQGEIFLYYSVMDRADGVWKIALTRFSKD
jgi:hypothetical protein